MDAWTSVFEDTAPVLAASLQIEPFAVAGVDDTSGGGGETGFSTLELLFFGTGAVSTLALFVMVCLGLGICCYRIRRADLSARMASEFRKLT